MWGSEDSAHHSYCSDLVFDPIRRQIHAFGRTNSRHDNVTIAQSKDFLLVKYATNGTRLASFAFGSNQYDFIETAQYDSATDLIYIAGRMGPFNGLTPGGDADIYWAALNPTNYSRIRHGMFGSTGAKDNAYELALFNTNSTNGTMIIVGEGETQPFDGNSMGNTANGVGFISHYSLNGTKMWTSVLSGGPNSKTGFRSVAVFADFVYVTVLFPFRFPFITYSHI
jgi:hypothetical protein